MKNKSNYSIETLLKKYELGSTDEEVLYLLKEIEKYKELTGIFIARFVQEYDATHVRRDNKEIIEWVSRFVFPEYKVYVRCELMGLPYDVLKKSANKYKNLEDIGITIEPMDNNQEDWLNTWREESERLELYPYPPIVETHAHYDLNQYNGITDEVMELIHDAGIGKCIIPSVEAYKIENDGKLIDLNEKKVEQFKFYDWIYFAFASHPKYIYKDPIWDVERWERFEKLLEHPKCVAVGETGLDYSYAGFCQEHQKLQEKFFVSFIEQANYYGLPMVLHLRNGIQENDSNNDTAYYPDVYEDVIRILEQHPIKYGAVCHCFSGTITDLRELMNHGVRYFGIGGAILKDNPSLIKAVRAIQEEGILLETDSPYINIHPEIKGPNTSLLLYKVAERLAYLRESSVDGIICASNRNAEKLFWNR